MERKDWLRSDPQMNISPAISSKKISAGSSTCMLPITVGTGHSQLNRFYYNAALQLCVPFIYSGLGGNQNNFVTLDECTRQCFPMAMQDATPCKQKF